MKLIFQILLTMVMVGCGEHSKEEFTFVSFNQEPHSRVSLNKGVMIVAENLTLHKSQAIFGGSLEGLPPGVFLPNGEYIFYAYGFDGANPVVFNNTMYCDAANNGNPIGLFGSEVKINLNLHNESGRACPPMFGPNSLRNTGTLYTTNMYFCNGAFNSSSFSSICIGTPPSLGSYVELSILRVAHLLNGPPEPVFKNCINLTSGYSITSMKVPFGPQFIYSIKKFSNSNCTTPVNNNVLILGDIPNIIPSGSLTGTNVDFARGTTNPMSLYINRNLL